MAEPATILTAITTAGSVLLGGGALWRSMRQDTTNAASTRTDAAIASLERQLADRTTAEQTLRSELNAERAERRASEERLRREHAEQVAALQQALSDVRVLVARCEERNKVLDQRLGLDREEHDERP